MPVLWEFTILKRCPCFSRTPVQHGAPAKDNEACRHANRWERNERLAWESSRTVFCVAYGAGRLAVRVSFLICINWATSGARLEAGYSRKPLALSRYCTAVDVLVLKNFQSALFDDNG